MRGKAVDLQRLRRLLHDRDNRRKLEETLGISRQAVERWVKKGLPADRLIDVTDVLGVPPHCLMPSLYRDYSYRARQEPTVRS